MKIILTLLTLFLFQDVCLAKLNLKFRAREHFVDSHVFTFSDNTKATYASLSNTINYWHEVPFKYSFGLSFSPLLAKAQSKEGSSPFGDSLQLKAVGLEAKYYPFSKVKYFIRAGASYTKIVSDGSLNGISGTSYYLGTGWEFPVWKIHLAPEFAIRTGNLSQDISFVSTIFSIGFHFYKGF